MKIIDRIAKVIKETFANTLEKREQEKSKDDVSVKEQARLLKAKAIETGIPILLYSLYRKLTYENTEKFKDYGLEDVLELSEIEIGDYKCRRKGFKYNGKAYALATCDDTFYFDFGAGSVDHRYIHLFVDDKKIASLDFNKFNDSDENPYDFKDYECKDVEDVKGFIEGAWVDELKMLEKQIRVVNDRESEKYKALSSEKETKELKENFGIE